MNLVRYVWSIREKSSRESDNEYIRILFERQKEQILVDCRAKIQKHEFQAETDERSILELIGIIDSKRTEIDHTVTGCEQSKRSITSSRRIIRTKPGSW